jgi:hypothetical protein
MSTVGEPTEGTFAATPTLVVSPPTSSANTPDFATTTTSSSNPPTSSSTAPSLFTSPSLSAAMHQSSSKQQHGVAGSHPDQLPDWLASLKTELLSTGEWGALVREVYNGVTGRLEQNHIQFFSDLHTSEKSLFIDEVEKSLFSTPTYKKFQGMLSRALDHSLSDAVSSDILMDLERKDILDNQASNKAQLGATVLGLDVEQQNQDRLRHDHRRGATADDARRTRAQQGVGHRIDLILERASEGAVKLLQRLPNEKSTLRIMLNKEFPPKLRYQAWRLYLGHPEAREKYEKAIVLSRMSTISDQDADISLKCQALLDGQLYQQDMMVRVPNPHTILVNMKTVLSYYQKVSNIAVVPDNYYSFAIPLVYVYGINYDKTASVIESFFGLLEMPRPKYMANMGSQLTDTLRKHDRDLYEHVGSTYQKRDRDVEGGGGGGTEDKYISELLHHSILHLFVGVLNIDATCYVWDQCLMLGSFERLVPNFAIAMLILMREELMKANTPQQIQRVLDSQARTISCKRLGTLSERLFMGEMRNKLGIRVSESTDAVADGFFEKVQREEKTWNNGVSGLDEAMDW